VGPPRGVGEPLLGRFLGEEGGHLGTTIEGGFVPSLPLQTFGSPRIDGFHLPGVSASLPLGRSLGEDGGRIGKTFEGGFPPSLAAPNRWLS
jgi:hypothetical protein